MVKLILYRLKKVQHFFKTLLFEAVPANIQYGFPSRKLKILAITGTDGKTTSSTMLYHVLKHAGKKVGLISTVAAYIGDQQLDTGFHVTTPSPRDLQKYLKKMVDQGFEYVVLETTSHGIYQYRTWGITPYVMGLTNITNNEALDYHVEYPLYVRSKTSKLLQSNQAFLNKDDVSFPLVESLFAEAHRSFDTYSLKDPQTRQILSIIKKRFDQRYNWANALMVYKIAQTAEVSDQTFEEALQSFEGVTGRMQTVPNGLGKTIIVDFAHTPNGLFQALTSLREQLQTGQKLIAVFGCAGLRDPGKRRPMGEHAATIADYAVFTAEDPRTEDIWSIIRQMKEFLQAHHGKIHSIPDRQMAIEFAIHHLAKKGDVVAIFGKGHEQSMAYNSTEYLWNDVDAIKRALKNT